jgi:hypothetical protein
VRILSLQRPGVASATCRAPALIALGIGVLLASAWWPAAPVVTAMAVVTLGATEATSARFRGKSAMMPAMIVHGATYAGLYGLFIGATLHASTAGVGVWKLLDVAASFLPVALALLRILAGLRQHVDSLE